MPEKFARISINSHYLLAPGLNKKQDKEGLTYLTNKGVVDQQFAYVTSCTTDVL